MKTAPPVVQTWTLHQARIIKHTSGPFNTKGTDLAIEELVLAYERFTIEFEIDLGTTNIRTNRS
jgi:T4-like virus tail tube protein gp19